VPGAGGQHDGVRISELFVFAMVLVVPMIVGQRVGIARGHEVAGLALGLLFSWLGVVATMVLFPKPAACPGAAPRS